MNPFACRLSLRTSLDCSSQNSFMDNTIVKLLSVVFVKGLLRLATRDSLRSRVLGSISTEMKITLKEYQGGATVNFHLAILIGASGSASSKDKLPC